MITLINLVPIWHHTVITLLLTIYPMLYFTPHDYSVTADLSFLIPSPFPSNLHHPIWQSSKCSIYESLSVLVYSFWSFRFYILCMIYSLGTWHSRSIHVFADGKILRFYDWVIVHYMYPPFLLYPFIYW